ncbi:MAG TPA: hypothetical protein VGX76_14835, partial [Pirellulales bacterium]|nr:hypothetical protein [Pirellulales bacterium]
MGGFAVAAFAFLLAGFTPLFAQKGFLDDFRINPATTGADDEAVSVSASFTADRGGLAGTLSIAATMGPGYHIYSITQPDGGPIRTKIKLEASREFELTGNFEPAETPAEHVDQVAFPGVSLEEHEGTVTWNAPIRFAEGVEPAQLTISGKVYAQACNAQHCNPPMDFPFKATLAIGEPSTRMPQPTRSPVSESKIDVGEYTTDKQVTFRAHIEPKVVEPGGTVRLIVTAEPNQDGGWHIYEAVDEVPEKGNKPTLIVFANTSGLLAGRP